MQTVVTILMVLVCFSFLLKQTFIPRGAMFVTATVLALFTALTWGYAIEQSKTQISAWLANQSLMRDISVCFQRAGGRTLNCADECESSARCLRFSPGS